MLWKISLGLLALWIVAMVCSVTLAGWIYVLPAVAALLLILHVRRPEPELAEYTKWKLAHARRRRRDT